MMGREIRSSRRTASVMNGNEIGGISNPNGETMQTLARPQETRRFKTVGVHINSLGVCEDMVIIEQILDLLDSLKLNDLDSILDGNAELVNR